MNGQSDGLKMKQSFNATGFRDGQVNGGWGFGSMTTMRSSTPDALDGRVEEGECQTTAEPGHGGGVRAVPLHGEARGKPFVECSDLICHTIGG